MGSTRQPSVAVVGSANLDVVVVVDRFPVPGETVLGRGPQAAAGGKGLNQALAAARQGRSALVARVGRDAAAASLLSALEAADVDTRHVRPVAGPTGQAFIQVGPGGENSIVVAPAANGELSPEGVQRALGELQPALVLAQLEVPLESVEAAAEWAAAHQRRFVLNPSPVRSLPEALAARCDPLVANRHEAAELTGASPSDDPERLAAGLAGRALSAVVTDGSRGAWVASAYGVEHFPGVRVETVVDTTGAGDEFVGCLAACLARGDDLPTATAAANRAAARVVSLPRDQR